MYIPFNLFATGIGEFLINLFLLHKISHSAGAAMLNSGVVSAIKASHRQVLTINKSKYGVKRSVERVRRHP
jgi:hypothetical protein